MRVVVRSGGRAIASAASVLELLDELNEGGLLKYGGLKVESGDSVFIYVSAA